MAMHEPELIPSEDELPRDNADLAKVAVSLRRLHPDSLEGCPVSMDELLDYLALEVPHGELLTEEDLSFIRTADIKGSKYWIWSFHEPGGSDAFATVSRDRNGTTTIGYEANYYNLSPEQFVIGSYYRCL